MLYSNPSLTMSSLSSISAVSRRQGDDDAAVALHSSEQKGEGSVSLHSFDV